MKTILARSILFSLIALPVLGQLSDADLNKIRLIVKEEVKSEITASEVSPLEQVASVLIPTSTPIGCLSSNRGGWCVKLLISQSIRIEANHLPLRLEITTLLTVPL